MDPIISTKSKKKKHKITPRLIIIMIKARDNQEITKTAKEKDMLGL